MLHSTYPTLANKFAEFCASPRTQAGSQDIGSLFPNFVAGFGYVLAGVGLWLSRRWAPGAAAALAMGTACVAVAFYAQVQGGGAYEPRTVGALGLRLAFWSVVVGLAWRSARRKGL